MRYLKDKEKFKEVLEKYSNIDFGTFKVSSIELMKSTLTKGGPIYEAVESFALL